MSDGNSDQITHWNEVSGPKWVRYADTINAQLEPIGLATMDRADIRVGERVLDVGCGCGQTSVELGRRVGSGGGVHGVDVSAPMLADARERAAAANLAHVQFSEADAQDHRFDPADFDLLFSRFGVMFFADAAAAFSNLHDALKADARLCFVCWQEIAKNPWMAAPAMTAAQFVELPAPQPPGSPGPFSFADPAHVTAVLQKGGFRDVRCEALEGETEIGAGQELPEIVAFMLQMGPAGAALRSAGEDVQTRATAAAIEVLGGAYREGAVRMPYAAWIVQANA